MVGKYGPTDAGISERRGYDMRAGILSINIYTRKSSDYADIVVILSPVNAKLEYLL